MKINITAPKLDMLKYIYFVKIPDLTERQIEGLVCTLPGKSLYDNLLSLMCKDEVCIFRNPILTNIQWEKFKRSLLCHQH